MKKRPETILRDLPVRFWNKVEKTDGCWLWTASVNEHGYGKFRWFGKSDRAHRIAYILTNGSIPNNLCVLHKCDNPRCVRPDHMFIGTRTDNAKDRAAKGRAPSGENASWSKLTNEQVLKIRFSDDRTQRQIAAEYGISQQHVSAIKLGHWWRKPM